MPTLAYRARMSRRVAWGFVVLTALSFAAVQYGQYQIDVAHAARYKRQKQMQARKAERAQKAQDAPNPPIR